MAMSLILYGGPRTRASMPRWYLEEKGIAYELKELDLRGNQHRQPDYLAEHHAGEIQSASQRSLTAQWLLFANATLAIALFVPSNREREFPRLIEELNRQLQPGRPLVGDQWGAADCAVTAYLAYLPIFFPKEDLSPYPAIQSLITSTQQRPAYRKAMGMS